MPRRRNKKIAIVLAGVFVFILFLELLAIFSPALTGILAQHRSVELKALAPPGTVTRAELEEVAKALGARKYQLVPLNVTANNATRMFYTLVVYVDGEPLVATIVPRTANATVVARVVDVLLREAQRLPSNESVLYLGGNRVIPIPRNETHIMALVEALYRQLASHPPIPAAAGHGAAAGNSTRHG